MINFEIWQCQLSCIFYSNKKDDFYGRPLGAKWNTAASVCLGFPSWCKIFATVPLHVSPSTHLTCLTYALTILNFFRSQIFRKIVRMCVLGAFLSTNSKTQTNTNASSCSSSQLFLHFIHSFSCFYYKNLYNISF